MQGKNSLAKEGLFRLRDKFYPHCIIIPREGTNSFAAIVNPYNIFVIKSVSRGEGDPTGNGGLALKLSNLSEHQIKRLKIEKKVQKGFLSLNKKYVENLINKNIRGLEERKNELLRLEKADL